jgi:hypothetical protein
MHAVLGGKPKLMDLNKKIKNRTSTWQADSVLVENFFTHRGVAAHPLR